MEELINQRRTAGPKDDEVFWRISRADADPVACGNTIGSGDSMADDKKKTPHTFLDVIGCAHEASDAHGLVVHLPVGQSAVLIDDVGVVGVLSESSEPKFAQVRPEVFVDIVEAAIDERSLGLMD